MPEIMSAEELDEYMSDVTFSRDDNVFFAVHNRDERLIAIRSRDSAMLEKYKEAIAMVLKDHCMYPGKIDVIISALDSAYAEIEGGK